MAVATVPGGFTELASDLGIDVVDIDFRGRDPRALTVSLVRLKRYLRKFKPDVMHAHTIAATVVSRMAAAGSKTTVVSTVHNEYQRGVFLMGAAHKVVGVSEAVSEAMGRRRIPRRKIYTVMNGTIGSPRRPAENQPGISLKRPCLVAVGAISHRKGADLLTEVAISLAESHGTHTYAFGNVDWGEPVKVASESRYAENVKFMGFTDDPRDALAQADVFVLASRRDPAPLVLIEALEAGCAIVAAAVDGVPEMLSPSAGVLVPPDDPSALVETIAGLLDDSGRRLELQAAAKRRAGHFTTSRVASEYRDVYESRPRTAPNRKSRHPTP